MCFDNKTAKSFWSTLSNEYYHRHTWPTKAQATTAVARWIEVAYNQRRHSKIGDTPPVEFEQQYQTGNTEEQSA